MRLSEGLSGEPIGESVWITCITTGIVSSGGAIEVEADNFKGGAETDLASGMYRIMPMLKFRIVINTRFIGLGLGAAMQLLLIGAIDLKLANSHECIPV